MGNGTNIGRVRGLGSAKAGTEHFWQQRLTAIANIPLVIFLVVMDSLYLGIATTTESAALGVSASLFFA